LAREHLNKFVFIRVDSRLAFSYLRFSAQICGYSRFFPFVSGSCVAMIAVSTNAIAHSRNAALSPFLSPTQPMV
jgi:hypothetical protein